MCRILQPTSELSFISLLLPLLLLNDRLVVLFTLIAEYMSCTLKPKVFNSIDTKTTGNNETLGRILRGYTNIQLMHYFEGDIRFCHPEKVMLTEVKLFSSSQNEVLL